MILGTENIAKLFRLSGKSDSTRFQDFVARNLFGMPIPASESFLRDKSGYSSTPAKGSNMEARNRICYRDRQILMNMLQGSELSVLMERFTLGVTQRIQNLPIGEEWVEMPDLFDFFATHITPSVIECFCGEELTKVFDPCFVQRFWEFDHHTPVLSKHLPRWMFKSSYKARDSVLQSLVRWRTWMLRIPEEREIAGMSRPFRDKLQLLDVDGWSIEAVAASDLGFIWG